MYDNPLAVVMLHNNIKTNPNPNLNPTGATTTKQNVVHFSGTPLKV